MSIHQNRLKSKLREGGFAFGTWIIDSRHQSVVRQIADAGFDYVFLEMEHSSLSWETIGDFCEMSRASGMTPIVRLAEHTRPFNSFTELVTYARANPGKHNHGERTLRWGHACRAVRRGAALKRDVCPCARAC